MVEHSKAWHDGYSDYYDFSNCPSEYTKDDALRHDWCAGYLTAANDDYDQQINSTDHPDLYVSSRD